MNAPQVKRGGRIFGHSQAYRFFSEAVFRRLYARIATDILEAGAPAGATVLDAGCGPGTLLLQLSRRRPDLALYGADITPEMIAEADRAAAASGARDVRFTAADLADLPYADDTFDLIVSSASMHHWADIPAALRGLARALRPGGSLRVYDSRFAVPTREFLAAAERVFGNGAVTRTLVRRHRFSIALLQRFDITADA